MPAGKVDLLKRARHRQIMMRSEVAKAVGALIAAAEAELGMPAGSGSDAERLKAIVASGEPLPPEIYACLFGGGGDGSR